MKKTALVFFLLISLLPTVAFAAIPNWGPLLTCSGAPGSGSKLPKCTSICDLLATGKNILEFVMTLALFIIAPLMAVIGGFMVLVSGANPGLRSKGMQTIRATIISIVLVVIAFVVVNTFITIFSINKNKTFIQGFSQPIECSVPNTIQSP
jgi:hypothetical protein